MAEPVVFPIWGFAPNGSQGGRKTPTLSRVEVAGSTLYKQNISKVESVEKLIGKNKVFVHLKTGERIFIDADKNTVLSLLH